MFLNGLFTVNIEINLLKLMERIIVCKVWSINAYHKFIFQFLIHFKIIFRFIFIRELYGNVLIDAFNPLSLTH